MPVEGLVSLQNIIVHEVDFSVACISCAVHLSSASMMIPKYLYSLTLRIVLPLIMSAGAILRCFVLVPLSLHAIALERCMTVTFVILNLEL